MRAAVTTLILCVGGLLALGMVALYSATNAQFGTRYLMMQGMWSGLGVLACIAVASFNYQFLQKLAVPFFVAAVIALALVLVPGIGEYRNGSRRWFDFGFASFQPSEAAKIALIVMLAWYGERYQKQMSAFWRGLIIPGGIASIALALVFLEPDRGTTILLAAVTGVMLLLAGVRWFYVVPPAVLFAAGMIYVLLTDPVRLRRIMSWLDPEAHKDSVAGYQGWQSLIAIGSGGSFGLGLGNGRQKLGFVPEHQTDFIFSIIGEEMGLIGTLAIIAAFVVLVLCGVYIAMHAKDVFGLLLAGGITFLVGMQAFINIGVVTSALPNKGLPLPFISYGGSSMLLMLLAVGILLSVARQAGPPGAEEIEDTDLRTQFA